MKRPARWPGHFDRAAGYPYRRPFIVRDARVCLDDPYRPPLAPIVYEGILEMLHKIDQRHWPLIASMRIANHYPLSVPVPPQLPLQLFNQLWWYAAMLFKAEADQYEQFRSNESYPSWLSWLADRVIRRVIDAYKKLEQTNDATLAYHGHTVERIQENLKANF